MTAPRAQEEIAVNIANEHGLDRALPYGVELCVRASIAAALRSERKRALEEAARVADREKGLRIADCARLNGVAACVPVSEMHDMAACSALIIADAIRALADDSGRKEGGGEG